MERKRKLKAAEQGLGGSDASSETQDQRVYTRNELEDLRRSNPAEYKRAIDAIVKRTDTEGSGFLGDLITH
jgi:phosphoribosylformylglycinamidine (FGAM) synthase-like enzyme